MGMGRKRLYSRGLVGSRILPLEYVDSIKLLQISIILKYTEQNYKRNTFVFAPFFMSWTQKI